MVDLIVDVLRYAAEGSVPRDAEAVILLQTAAPPNVLLDNGQVPCSP